MKKSSSNSSNALAKNQKIVEQVKRVLDKMSPMDAENYLRNFEIPAIKLTSSELKALKAGGSIIGLLWELFKPKYSGSGSGGNGSPCNMCGRFDCKKDGSCGST